MIPGTAKAVTFVLTTNRERARSFYEHKLGPTCLSKDDYAVVFDLNGATLRVTLLAEHQPSEQSVLGWTAPDIGRAVEGLNLLGIAVERRSFLPQDESGIWTSPDEAARVAFFKDPNGNVLSLTQS
jgi:catechol 2,3-dioxygenase-like lactoylglutathione lyase family enzyme